MTQSGGFFFVPSLASEDSERIVSHAGMFNGRGGGGYTGIGGWVALLWRGWGWNAEQQRTCFEWLMNCCCEGVQLGQGDDDYAVSGCEEALGGLGDVTDGCCEDPHQTNNTFI